ncbi:MAG: hypothetical protein LBS19_01240 [Clostridiales bacterium]|jgi:hypothetical protein|nr:hypothetical protein [Clostridiales bacterium]
MAKQSIDTARVGVTITKLKSVNNAIDNEMSALERTSKRLDDGWNSSAGDAAIGTLRRIISGGKARHSVIKNYIAMLEQQINPGYIAVEEHNTKLADNFK